MTSDRNEHKDESYLLRLARGEGKVPFAYFALLLMFLALLFVMLIYSTGLVPPPDPFTYSTYWVVLIVYSIMMFVFTLFLVRNRKGKKSV